MMPGALAQGKILRIAFVAFALAVPAAADEASRDKRISELQSFLGKKEKDLARLTSLHSEKLKKADPLVREVEQQKDLGRRGWFEQRALEKNLAKLRPQLEEIERIAAERRAVREEAFAAASAIVSEIESAMEEGLDRLKVENGPAARGKLVESLKELERERRAFQGKASRLMPTLPLPADLPADAPWSDEMAEDICGAYEAAVARLETEREDLLKEQRLRRSLAENLPDTAGSSEGESRLKVALAETEHKLRNFREKLAGQCAGRDEEK